MLRARMRGAAGAIACKGERSQLDRSECRRRGAMSCGGERSFAEGIDRAGGGAMSGGGVPERLLVVVSDCLWTHCGGERLQLQRSSLRYREVST